MYSIFGCLFSAYFCWCCFSSCWCCCCCYLLMLLLSISDLISIGWQRYVISALQKPSSPLSSNNGNFSFFSASSLSSSAFHHRFEDVWSLDLNNIPLLLLFLLREKCLIWSRSVIRPGSLDYVNLYEGGFVSTTNDSNSQQAHTHTQSHRLSLIFVHFWILVSASICFVSNESRKNQGLSRDISVVPEGTHTHVGGHGCAWGWHAFYLLLTRWWKKHFRFFLSSCVFFLLPFPFSILLTFSLSLSSFSIFARLSAQGILFWNSFICLFGFGKSTNRTDIFESIFFFGAVVTQWILSQENAYSSTLEAKAIRLSFRVKIFISPGIYRTKVLFRVFDINQKITHVSKYYRWKSKTFLLLFAVCGVCFLRCFSFAAFSLSLYTFLLAFCFVRLVVLWFCRRNNFCSSHRSMLNVGSHLFPCGYFQAFPPEIMKQ